MKNYEIMFIVKPTQESEGGINSAEELKKVITDNKSKVVDFKKLGQKKLAYPIKKETTGFYYLLTIEATVDAINAFSHKALIDENILRHMIINLDEE